MAVQKITIAELNINTKAFLQQAKRTRESIDKLLLSQQKLKALGQEHTKVFIKNQTALKGLRSQFLLQQKAVIALETPYGKLSRTLIIARENAKNIGAQFGVNSRQFKKASAEVRVLDKRLKTLDKRLGVGGRSVGLYGSAIKGLATSFLGLTAIIFGVFRAIKDVFGRVVRFDKAMVGLAAILNVNRSELKDLELEIKNVAGASIKTSNEVAELATTLIVLGKSKSEVIKLLKPVNDLSIALEATSQEAGELLVQTLNAFGKSSDSAEEYADIIAKMRTSTALNFERIKDSLGFLAPTAKAAGVSFENTAAILGVLVDNGIKAARAGRLISTSFLTLARDGKTLEDALDEINEAQTRGVTATELLKVAGDLFGARSAALGLILADNREKVAGLTKEFENSKGTLDSLTKGQLKSISAQTRILDSTWEKLILNIENGNGVIAGAFRGIIKFATGIISAITPTEKLSENIEKERINLLVLETQINNVNTSQEDRIKLIKTLQDKYPDFLGNLNAEKVSNEEISRAIKSVNDQLINKIILQKKDEEIAAQNEETAKFRIKSINREKEVRKALAVVLDKMDIKADENLTLTEQSLKLIKNIRNARGEEQQALADLSIALQGYRGLIGNTNIEEEKGNILLTEKAQLIKDLGLTIEETPTIPTGGGGLTDEEKAALLKAEADFRKEQEDNLKKQREKEKEDLIKFEQEKIDLQNEIDLSRLETDREKAEEKSLQRKEKELLEIEELTISIELKDELIELTETAHLERLFDIRDVAREKETKADEIFEEKNRRLKAKFAKQEIKADQKIANQKIAIQQKITSILTGLLGDSIAAVIANAIADAFISIANIKVRTTAAQAINLANATAVSALDPSAIPRAQKRNITLGIQSKISQALIIASGVANLAKGFATGGKVGQGNIQHQSNGDNVLTTLKTGEVVLNEQQQSLAGGSEFFKSIGVPGFAHGGVVGIDTTTRPALNQPIGFNIEQFTDVLAEKINDIKIVTIVDEVTDAQISKTEIINGAII